MVAGKRRRRMRAALGGATVAVAVAAVTVSIAAVVRTESPTPATTGGRNALFAVRHTDYLATSARGTDVHRWEVLDPETGDYRNVMVKTVSEPTNDLRYAAVLPKGEGDQVPGRVGRYEATTGAIRWYDIPVRPDFATISPDGRYAAARGWDERAQAADIAVVDLDTAQVRRFNTAHLYGSSEPSPPRLPDLALALRDERTPEVAWTPDSGHLLFGIVITDLDGRLTGRLPLPAEVGFVRAHREGAGTLVRTGLGTTDYALVDDTGAIPHGVKAGDWTCATPTPSAMSDRCVKPWAQFLSWRGRDEILIQTAPGPRMQAGSAATERPREPARYEALDLRTGHHEAVSLPHFDGDGPAGDVAHSFVVVISAEHLSGSARDRVAF
ncbi:hypothetical protein Pflav_031980 [Phytohabitans flavus]|uniref:Uncharacterized protein n=2 Tax=Phytohabitans flavus TaxID=1076124 RepID=A0A6F8XSR2_9ACTN|nr:hypothetical protein [Phytohabitans flavus]BCB76788.1 hypothetical protein Pflav_031980 [Phytohabitans flavus]